MKKIQKYIKKFKHNKGSRKMIIGIPHKIIEEIRNSDLNIIDVVSRNDTEPDKFYIAKSTEHMRELRNNIDGGYLVFVPENISYWAERDTHLYLEYKK